MIRLSDTSQLKISSSSIISNIALSGSGGAFALFDSSRLAIDDSLITGNRAFGGGGGIALMGPKNQVTILLKTDVVSDLHDILVFYMATLLLFCHVQNVG